MMALYSNAYSGISPEDMALLSGYESQSGLTTGQRPTPGQTRGMWGAILENRQKGNLQRTALQQQRNIELNRQMQQADAIKAGQKGSMVGGIGQGMTGLYGTYKMGTDANIASNLKGLLDLATGKAGQASGQTAGFAPAPSQMLMEKGLLGGPEAIQGLLSEGPTGAGLYSSLIPEAISAVEDVGAIAPWAADAAMAADAATAAATAATETAIAPVAAVNAWNPVGWGLAALAAMPSLAKLFGVDLGIEDLLG
jgi:hypothetical protein